MKRSDGKQILRLLFWESTIKCNLNCVYCRRLESDNTSLQDMTTDGAKEMLEQLAQLGKKQGETPLIVFSGGEPLSRNDLFELIEQARILGIRAALATNGTLVDDKVGRRIRRLGVERVSVSLDAASPEVHDTMRGAAGSFVRAIAGIKHLKENNVGFQINVTLTKANAGQLRDIYKLAESLAAEALHIFMLVGVGCGRILADREMLSPQEYERKLLEICELEGKGRLEVKVTCGPHYQRVIRQKGLPQSGKHAVGGRGCLAGWGVLFVSHRGDVFPCGYLPVRCGNILEDKLADIWYGSNDLAMLRDSDRLEGKCGVCSFRSVCGGCRGRAYSVSGNYMAEEPYCVYVPSGEERKGG